MRRLQADFGVVGAGEDCMPYLISELAAGRQPAPLLDARMLFPVPPPTLYTLDRLPLPDRCFVDPRYYELDGTDNIQTKRGCSFRCAYCDYPDLEGQRLQLRSPDAVADEVLQRAQAPDVSFLFFVDSVFNVPQKHALAICEALIGRGSPIPWVAYVSPVQLDSELVSAMARAGCVGVEIGSDTGTAEGLRRLGQRDHALGPGRRILALKLQRQVADDGGLQAVPIDEHRDLDAIINQIALAPPPGDDLLLRRLKKRRLLLKDRISIIQHLMDPDVPA